MVKWATSLTMILAGVISAAAQQMTAAPASLTALDYIEIQAVFLGGHYEDVYAKTSEGWRFKTRTFVASVTATPAAPAQPAAPSAGAK